ncbi:MULTISPECIES: Ig-like domain-containing protein [Pseudomonas]|uniref:Uncharacterized protein n=1 Tax=Pseudomonas mosselii TaxID=78327 RepID=A0A5R8Z725_9PSED|nr:hypothetical protein [Pseudomonas mosselii]TLP61075.1 hypothetical protein FEM01_10785 [Pseudomonas mosselii]
MARQTKNQFLQEMAKKPQTLGWDVILAFDRNKTNYLLLQDYISRFGATSLFPPVDSSIDPVAGTTHQLLGLQLDKPRLSFENAVITESRARCLMRTVGGKIIETTQPQGTTRKEVKRVGLADGLVGPILTMTINLRNAPGSVGSAGQVELDLAGNGATDFEMSGVDTRFERVKLGEHLKAEIATWSDSQKKFQLSELRQNPGDALQPGKFRVLTRPARGATLRTAEDFGDGEVLVMIGLDDREGALPPSDTSIPYMLPQGYSSNLIISNAQYVDRLLIPQLMSLLTSLGGEFKKELDGQFFKYVFEGGTLVISDRYYTYRIDDKPWSFSCWPTYMPFSGMTVRVMDNTVKLVWQGESDVMYAQSAKLNMDNPDNGNAIYDGNVAATWNLVQEFKVVVVEDAASGLPLIEIQPVAVKLESGVSVKKSGGNPRCKAEFDKHTSEHFEKHCYEHLKFLQSRFKSLTQTIDAFRLNGLLFRDTSVVVPKEIAVPGDLTILGDIAPKLTAYQLSDAEKVVAAGGTHQFSVQPSGLAVTWKVEDPLDSDRKRGVSPAAVGSISATGLYTAPSSAALGSSKRVIVTASATDGSWTGKALVHLVAAPVSVFPLVNVVNLTGENDEGYLVWAASTNKSALTWEITGNAGGKLVIADDPNVQDARRYHGPAVFPTGVSDLDSDLNSDLNKVLRVDRVKVSQADGTVSTCEMILTKPPKQDYYFTHKSVADGIQFSFWLTLDGGEELELLPEDTTWVKVSGHGNLDANGLYTFPTDSVDHYVVVAAIDRAGGTRNLMWNYTILPLPLMQTSNEQVRP